MRLLSALYLANMVKVRLTIININEAVGMRISIHFRDDCDVFITLSLRLINKKTQEISYQDTKDFIYDSMNAQEPDKNPISWGSGFAIDHSTLLHPYQDYDLTESFIACGLFELEHNALEERIEAQMTYWIY